MAAPATGRLQPTVLVFSWNAEELRICETTVQAVADAARAGFKGLLRKPCISPTFLNYLRDSILLNQPQLVVVATPNEANDASYLHSDTLPELMPTLQYQLIRREKIADVGQQVIATVTGATAPALRISVYAHTTVVTDWTYADKSLMRLIPNGVTDSVLQYGRAYAGMIALHFWHRYYGKFAIAAMDIPEDALPVQTYSYSKNRLASNAVSNISLLTWLTSITDEMSPAERPDHIILCGSFNYQMVVPDKSILDVIRGTSSNLSQSSIKSYQQYDEGILALKKGQVLEGFSEGIGGQGPLFMPTWRLTKGRGSDCNLDYPRTVQAGAGAAAASSSAVSASCFTLSETNGSVGWKDRIYYRDFFTSTYVLTCEQYDRLDDPSMNQSSHASVTAIIRIGPYR